MRENFGDAAKFRLPSFAEFVTVEEMSDLDGNFPGQGRAAPT